MARGGGYTAQTAAIQKEKSRREALADQTYGFNTKGGNAIKAGVVMAQREATAKAQVPDARNPLAAFEARQRLADVEAAPVPAVAGTGPSWQALIEKRMAEKAPTKQAGPKLLDTSTPEKQAEMERFIMEAPPAAPKLLDTSTPEKQAEMERFIREAPPAAPKLLDTSTPDKQKTLNDWIMNAPPAATAPTTATPAAPAAGRDINTLFAKATGTAFDPKSRLDIARKAELEDLLKSNPELASKSDTQIALQYYRQMENAKRK